MIHKHHKMIWAGFIYTITRTVWITIPFTFIYLVSSEFDIKCLSPRCYHARLNQPASSSTFILPVSGTDNHIYN